MSRASVRIEGDTVVLSGVVDFDSVPDLVDQLAAGNETVVTTVDASDVTRIDSAGAAFLVWLRKHHTRDDDTLSLRAAPEQLTRLLAVTGLDAVIG